MWELIPEDLGKASEPIKNKKAPKISRLDVGVEGFEPPTLCL
jgi:hypothetical protein